MLQVLIHVWLVQAFEDEDLVVGVVEVVEDFGLSRPAPTLFH